MSFADRGKVAEKAAQKYLDGWSAASPFRDYERLVDTKSAGRIIKAAAADFQYYTPQQHGLIEVKETEHDYRLSKDRITQLPRLRKREKCGGRSFVLLYHSQAKMWRVLDVPFMAADPTGGSWDLRTQASYSSVAAALWSALPTVFDL